VSLLNLNILGKMAFGALGGCEATSVFAGECQDASVARTLRASVWISAPVVTAVFTLGTACILAYTRPDALDLVSPVAQNLSRAAGVYGFAGPIVPLAMLLMLIARIGTGVIAFNAVSRLPMVAGWDNLLPSWFTRLHPTYRTPTGSILFVTVMVFAFVVLSNLDVGSQEAYQLLNNGAGISYALTYLVMFAIPLVARGERAPAFVRVAAASGFAMTLLYVVLSVFPIIAVQNAGIFALKVSGVVMVSNLLGAAVFLTAERQSVRPFEARA
jgi:glutamate:GABA antiporter